MMKLSRRLTPLLLALCVSACTSDGYSKSPVVADYFRDVVPAEQRRQVAAVALCTDEHRHQAVTVLLEDGQEFEYWLPENGAAPKLEYESTESSRKFGRESGWSVSVGCLGIYEGNSLVLTPRGDYRILVGLFSVRAEVNEELIHNTAFDATARTLLRRAAGAVNDAVARQKTVVPNESTWGLKP